MSAKLATRQIPVGELNLYPANPRRGDVAAIRASLERNGQYRALVVRASTMEVLAGNHTLLAIRELGWPKALCHLVDADDETARRIVLADNRTAELAGYDEQALSDLLSTLGGDLDGTGWTDQAFSELLATLKPDQAGADTDPIDPPAEPRTKPGDLYLLGGHRLLCGDATSAEDVAKLMGGGVAEMMVTSPPYNQRLDGFKPSGMQKEHPRWVERMARSYGDSMPEDAYQAEQVAMLDGFAPFMVDNASAFYNHKVRYRDKRAIFPMDWLARTGWRIRQEIVWDRASSITLNARMFMPQDERIYWLTRGGDFHFANSTEIKAWGTVWRIAPRADIQVSAPFPLEIPERAIRACCPDAGAVIDPFVGSGSTLIACENLGRRCFAMEIDPGYCDVIVDRWERHTGRVAELAP